jgi:ABC-type lipoprotein release transport system permease subunit
MAAPGVAAGLFGALLLAWLIEGTLTGLDLDSPMMFAAVGVLQLAVAMAAAAVPAFRASRANALDALRVE